MPKVTSNKYASPKFARHTVVARDELSGQRERIYIPPTTRQKFAKVGKPRVTIKPKILPLIKRIDPEFTAEIAAEYEEHTARQRTLHKLLRERSLLDRIQPTPLADRLTSPPPPPVLPMPAPAKELPQFKKTKIMKRQSEFYKMFDAAATRLGRVHDRWKIEMAKVLREVPANPDRLKRHEEIGVLLTRFNAVNTQFSDEYQGKLTNAHWRYVKRDLKRISRIPLYNVDGRWEDISRDLVTIKDIFDYLA